MKRIITLLTAVAMLIAMCCTTAVAENPGVYDSTRVFIDLLESEGVNYTYEGFTHGDYEVLIIPNTDSDAGIEYEIRFFFDPDNQRLDIRVWDLMKYDSGNYYDVLEACNSCHLSWKYVAFYAEPDNSITAGTDVIFRIDSCADVCWESTLRMVNVIGNAYGEYLGVYDISR